MLIQKFGRGSRRRDWIKSIIYYLFNFPENNVRSEEGMTYGFYLLANWSCLGSWAVIVSAALNKQHIFKFFFRGWSTLKYLFIASRVLKGNKNWRNHNLIITYKYWLSLAFTQITG